jgi:ribonuclease Z
LLFIEAAFAQADTALAAERAHLTTAVAGSLAREARVRRVEPFHFSPRYSGQEALMLDEVMTAFAGRNAEGAGS